MAFTKPDVNEVWADGGTSVSPGSAKISQGWVVEIPDFEFENFIQNRQDQFNAHVNQYGIPVWDNVTEYQAGKSYVQGSDGKLYQAITTNTGQNPVTQPTHWKVAFDDAGTSYTKTEADDRFLNESSNLSDLDSIPTARSNLSVYSKAESDSAYLAQSQNLADLADAIAARANLGLGTAAERNIGTGASDVLEVSEADSRYISLATGDGRWLNESSNLSDLPNKSTARVNLGVDYTLFNSSLGYYRSPGNFLIQWGTSTVAGGTTISYRISFSNVHVVVIGDGGNIADEVAVDNVTNSNFVFRKDGTGSTPMHWVAVGIG